MGEYVNERFFIFYLWESKCNSRFVSHIYKTYNVYSVQLQAMLAISLQKILKSALFRPLRGASNYREHFEPRDSYQRWIII